MAITPTKTWEYIINEVVSEASLALRNRTLWLTLKQALTNTGSLQAIDASASNTSLTTPWDVVASSNASTADASDNWSSVSDIVSAGAGVAHSWIHLRQVDFFGSGDHLHLLLAVENQASAQTGRMSIARGATGFNADGTTTNRPTYGGSEVEVVIKGGTTTAGDEIASDMMWGSDGSNLQAVFHFRIADDGSAGAWYITVSSVVVAWFGWQHDVDGDSTRVHPWLAWGFSFDSNAEQISWINILNAGAGLATLDDADTFRLCEIAQPCSGGLETPLSTRNTSSERMLMPAYVNHSSLNAVFSTLVDQWWGSTLESTGDQSPTTPPETFAQVGEMVIPWPSGEDFQVA